MLLTILKSALIEGLNRFGSTKRPNIWLSRRDEATNLLMNEKYFYSESESRKKVLNLLLQLNIKNVFEFGCNSGPNARLLVGQDLTSYVGLDTNESALKFAEEKINNNTFDFINWEVLNKKDTEFFHKFDTFFSIYSMSYIEFDTAAELLGKFKNCNYFIFCEPENKLRMSITLNRTPEYSHDYHKLIRLIRVGDFTVFQMDLDLPTYNTRRILFFVRQQL